MNIFAGCILLVIASVFAYVIWQISRSASHTINDDIARADEDNVESAKEDQRMMRILLPIVIAMFVLAILLLTGAYAHLNMVSIGVTAGGVLFTYLGIIFRTSASKKNARCTSRCTGQVIRQNENEDSEGHTSYYAVYSYTVNGNEYELVDSYGGGERAIPQVGEPMEIFYDPVSPKVAYSAYEGKQSKVFTIWFLAFGIPMIVIGIAIATPWYMWGFRIRSFFWMLRTIF